MNTSPENNNTPETDQEEMLRGGDDYWHDYIKSDFARKLERERDLARKIAETLLRELEYISEKYPSICAKPQKLPWTKL